MMHYMFGFLKSKSTSKHRLALGMLLFAVFCSQTQPVFAKLLYEDGWTPVSVYFLALVVVVVFLGIHEFLEFSETERWDMSKEDIFGTVLTTLLGGVISPILFYTGLLLISASDAVLISSSIPIFTVMFAVIFLGERFNTATVIGTVFLFSGLGMLLWSDIQQAQLSVGVPLILGAAVMSALTTIVHKKYIKNRHLDSVVFVRVTLSVLLVGAWMWFTEPESFELFLEPQKLQLVFGLPILGIIIPSFFFFGALRRLKAMGVGIVAGVGPIAGVLLAAAFLGEQIEQTQVASLLLIIFGILNINVPLTRWRIVPTRLMGIGPLRK